ncbi:hypothetical protein G7085_14965 [Tessaracoccus sp. HDW20]|uniref:hypothetical protein n=1 Tax=Tessaracoccus coleopterorum TaxID=2714950 RepID=UPI0018D4B071|nr:hypothetical protein [Tessaracoccus coleopterorum]NHB85479.1 hypothetical protein [Tessaracoccus coleopterorum]
MEQSGGSLIVDLSPEAYADLEGERASELARNQMVYTITDLVADPELSIRFLSDGGTPPRRSSTWTASGAVIST